MDTKIEDQVLDVTGLMCPMPLVKARQAINALEIGQILKVMATDRGSVKDFQGWAKTSKNIELVQQSEEMQSGKTVLVHYVKKTK